MAKTQHTFAKRQRELEKKRKADEKRARRRAKSQGSDDTTDTPGEIESSEDLQNTPPT